MKPKNNALLQLIKKSTKQELIKLAGSPQRCKHGHTIFSHPHCFDIEKGERVGVIDIEADHLKADFGTLICYVIKEVNEDRYFTNIILPGEAAKADDRRVVNSCINDMGKFDRLIGYYHTGFDIPFIRARASINDLNFPPFGSIYVDDIYYTVRRNFAISSKSLKNACKQLLGDTNKTDLDGRLWKLAARGDKEALTYVHEHCFMDVVDTERLFHYVKDFYKPQRKSL